MSDPQTKPISFQTFTKDLPPQPLPKLSPEEELQKFKHEFKLKENNFKKDAALNEQKIELLEIQIKEAKIREENLRKMNDNLTSALSELSQDPKKFQNAGLKEIQQTLEKNSKDFIENKMKNNELIKVLEAEIKKLQESLQQELLKRKDQDLDKEKEKVSLENKIHELEAEKNRLESIIKQIQLDQRKSFDNFTQDNQIKLNKHNEIVEKLKENHEREIEAIQGKRQQHFNEMRNIYEQEKLNLENRLEKAQAQLKQYIDISTQSFESDKYENLQKEKEKLSQTLTEINRNYSDELKLHKKNKEDLITRIRELEREILRLNEENGSFQKLKEEKKRLELDYDRSKLLIQELEKSEKSLKTLLNEYQHNFIIQGNNTDTQGSNNYTPQLHCEQETEETPLEESVDEENDNSRVLQENLREANKSSRKSKKSNSLASQDLEKYAKKQYEHELNQKSFKNLDKSNKKSQRNLEDLRKTPIQNRTSSTLQRTNEKQKISHPPKTSRNNENMPLPISELGLKSDRLTQFLENTSYKKPKTQSILEKKRLSDNTPFTALINLTPNCCQTPLCQENNNVATALLCEICKNSYPPLEFLDHLESCKSQFDNNMRNFYYENQEICAMKNHHHNSQQNLQNYPQTSNFNSVSEQKRTRSFHYQSAHQLHPCNSMNSTQGITQNMASVNDHKIINVLDNLNYEKKLIFDKLREVETRLRDTEDKNCMLHEEKVGLERHFENIVNQLKHAQLQLALNEEEKSENEVNLKKEIKFLIGKLLKAKNKLSEEKYSMVNNNNNNSSINMSGFLNFYQQNKEDSTFGEKNNNVDSETSILNQSIQHIISTSALTINHKNKSPMIQKPTGGKGQIVHNKTGSFGRKMDNNGRSKTPFMMKFGENANVRKLGNNNNFNLNGMDMKTDYVETLDMNNNRFKKKR